MINNVLISKSDLKVVNPKSKRENLPFSKTPPKKMIGAINSRNIRLMDEVTKKFSGDLNMVYDELGNSLVGIAAITGDHKMINILI